MVELEKDETIYIAVGGQGNSVSNNCEVITNGNGYNGGTSHSCQSNTYYGSGGGGATSISKIDGLLSTQGSDKDKVLIVAGAGAGASTSNTNTANHSAVGGHAGGIQGSLGVSNSSDFGIGAVGTQTEGGISDYRGNYRPAEEADFGKACLPHQTYSSYLKVAGGSGWYGGGCSTHAGGSGGSSYIGSDNLLTVGTEYKHMTCYDCTTSVDPNTMTISTNKVSDIAIADYAKKGNGYARVTPLSLVSANNYVKNITPSISSLNEEFNTIRTDYTVNVGVYDQFISFDVETYDATASVTGNENRLLSIGENVFNINRWYG